MASLKRPNLGSSSSGDTSIPPQSRAPSITRDKRHRRIRRACDDCRGRKIKCDGNSPCLSCSVSSKECTYTFKQKSRYAGPMYIEELEEKIEKLDHKSRNLKSLLSAVFPEVDVEDPDLEEIIQKQLLDEKQRARFVPADSGSGTSSRNTSHDLDDSPDPDELLDTMIEATGRLKVDGQGNAEYHGDFGGLAFLHQVGQRCNLLLDDNLSKSQLFSHAPLEHAFASESGSLRRSRGDSITMFHLPPRATAQFLAKIAFEDAATLMNFIHLPSFNSLLARLYSIKPENYSSVEEAFLPLLYVILAVGELFAGNRQGPGVQNNNLDQMRGVKWFRAGQALLDTANCRDIISLQAIVCIIIYLQSSALMHSCYSYISSAISISMQMGLHRAATSTHLDPIQQEIRKRTFWTILTMETYVTTLLGLPSSLGEEDIDQELPSCVDDEFISRDGITPMPAQRPSTMTAVNAHFKLFMIMRNLVKDIYPKVKNSSQNRGPYRVNYGRVAKIEADLEEWFHCISVPSEAEHLQPNTVRTQLLLRLAYAHVQMVLYRPFIHHIVRTGGPASPPEMRSYACASACIKAAMQIIWIIEELDNRHLLIGAYWFTVYITFFAVMALCMFIIGNPEDPTVEDTLRAAEKGRCILAGLATESVSAERCVTSLSTLFDKIGLLFAKQRAARASPTTSSMTTAKGNLKLSPTLGLRHLSDRTLTQPFSPSTMSLDDFPSTSGAFENSYSSADGGHMDMMFAPLDGLMGPEGSPMISPIYGLSGQTEEDAYFPFFNG